MGTWQHAGTDGDRTHGACVATIDTWLTAQDLAAYDLSFQCAEQFAHFIVRYVLEFRCRQCSRDLGTDGIHLMCTSLLLTYCVSCLQFVLSQCRYLSDERFVLSCWRPIPLVCAYGISHFVDRIDHDLHLLVTKHDCTQHDFFRQLLRF